MLRYWSLLAFLGAYNLFLFWAMSDCAFCFSTLFCYPGYGLHDSWVIGRSSMSSWSPPHIGWDRFTEVGHITSDDHSLFFSAHSLCVCIGVPLIFSTMVCSLDACWSMCLLTLQTFWPLHCGLVPMALITLRSSRGLGDSCCAYGVPLSGCLWRLRSF